MTSESADDASDELFDIPEQDRMFVRFMARLIDEQGLNTRSFIEAQIAAFEAYDAVELASFWHSALACYDEACSLTVGNCERPFRRRSRVVH